MSKGETIGAYLHPTNPDRVWVPGDPVPAWLRATLTDAGWDPDDRGDLHAGCEALLKPCRVPRRAPAADPAPVPAVIEAPSDAGALALSGESIARQILANGGAAALMAVGRIQAMGYMARAADYAIAQTFSELRRSKAYRGLPYVDDAGQPAVVSTIEQFCAVFIGRSYRRCMELEANLHTLGADLYESAEESGFQARDYAALRALPADDQAAVKAALEADDKDQALSVLADLVARQSAEKVSAVAAAKAAEAKSAEIKADYDALTGVVGEKEAKIRKLQADRLSKPATLDENTKAWGSFVAAKLADIRHALAQIDQVRLSALEFEAPAAAADSLEMIAYVRSMELLADQIGQLDALQEEIGGILAAHDSTLGVLAYGGGSES